MQLLLYPYFAAVAIVSFANCCCFGSLSWLSLATLPKQVSNSPYAMTPVRFESKQVEIQNRQKDRRSNYSWSKGIAVERMKVKLQSFEKQNVARLMVDCFKAERQKVER